MSMNIPTGEYFADGPEVHALSAVGDHAEQTQGLGQVLGRLRLAGSGRACQ